MLTQHSTFTYLIVKFVVTFVFFVLKFELMRNGTLIFYDFL